MNGCFANWSGSQCEVGKVCTFPALPNLITGSAWDGDCPTSSWSHRTTVCQLQCVAGYQLPAASDFLAQQTPAPIFGCELGVVTQTNLTSLPNPSAQSSEWTYWQKFTPDITLEWQIPLDASATDITLLSSGWRCEKTTTTTTTTTVTKSKSEDGSEVTGNNTTSVVSVVKSSLEIKASVAPACDSTEKMGSVDVVCVAFRAAFLDGIAAGIKAVVAGVQESDVQLVSVAVTKDRRRTQASDEVKKGKTVCYLAMRLLVVLQSVSTCPRLKVMSMAMSCEWAVLLQCRDMHIAHQ